MVEVGEIEFRCIDQFAAAAAQNMIMWVSAQIKAVAARKLDMQNAVTVTQKVQIAIDGSSADMWFAFMHFFINLLSARVVTPAANDFKHEFALTCVALLFHAKLLKNL